MHGSQYVTNFFARILVRDSLTNLKKIIGCKVLHFINNEDQEALGYKTLRHKYAVASFRENNGTRSPFACVLFIFSYVTAFKISLMYV